VLAGGLVLSLGAGAARAEDGLLMKQFSARYGSVTTMATHKNFRMDAAEIRVFIKPPFKTVAVYNTSSKTVYHSDIAALGKDIDWHDFKPDEIKAHVAERTVAKNDDRLQEYAMKRYLIEHYYPSRPTLPSLEFWTTRDKDFPHELDRACCLLSGLPVGYGFPLKVYQYRSRTKRDGTPYFAHYRVLDTSKIIKQNFPDTTFAEPAGCKPVKDLMELMVGEGGN
jgi:hypothetical protein